MVGLLTTCHQDREIAELEQRKREKNIALGNPLLMPTRDTEVKRRYSGYCMQQAVVAYEFSRWDDDVVFRHQARGTENKGKKEFVNVCSYGWQPT